ALKRYCKKRKLKLYEISAVTGKGIEELKYAMAKEVDSLREQAREQAAAAASDSHIGGTRALSKQSCWRNFPAAWLSTALLLALALSYEISLRVGGKGLTPALRA